MATYENPLAKFQTDNILTGRTEIESNITGTASVPIGAVLPWLKSLTGTPGIPDGWVECNGQTLNDTNSPYNGQTIPDLNGYTGTQRFLRGGGNADGSTPTVSGGTGGSETMTHTHVSNFYIASGILYYADNGDNGTATSPTATTYKLTGTSENQNLSRNKNSSSKDTSGNAITENKPPYYGVVWIMRTR